MRADASPISRTRTRDGETGVSIFWGGSWRRGSLFLREKRRFFVRTRVISIVLYSRGFVFLGLEKVGLEGMLGTVFCVQGVFGGGGSDMEGGEREEVGFPRPSFLLHKARLVLGVTLLGFSVGCALCIALNPRLSFPARKGLKAVNYLALMILWVYCRSYQTAVSITRIILYRYCAGELKRFEVVKDAFTEPRAYGGFDASRGWVFPVYCLRASPSLARPIG